MSDPIQQDERGAIYGALHAEQLRAEKVENEYSSRRILEILFSYYRPASMLDVGCGLGTWLKTAASLGVADVRGIEGQWIDPARLEIAAELVQTTDLEKSFELGRRFDLAVCLEVAEHLAETAADGLVAALVGHAPAVLFSAAIPFQGGDHHVNERFLPYWVAKFAHHGYRPIDFIRREIWDDEKVLWWLRQNIVLFVREDLAASNEKLRQASLGNGSPLSLVHPALYLRRMGDLNRITEFVKKGGLFRIEPTNNSGGLRITQAGYFEEREQLVNHLSQGGLFRTSIDESGNLTVTKVGEG